MDYQLAAKEELQQELETCQKEYQKIVQEGLNLNLARGKPGADQLELSLPLLDTLDAKSSLMSDDGMNCANYGGLDGITEAKGLIASMLETQPENVFVGGNSSLTLMFDIISHAMIDGIEGQKPWAQVENRKFLCPAPGYDRHFGMTEHFGFELITVPMLEDGPDMEEVERLVSSDDSIKGIWCVPKYSNPTGAVYSDEVVRRFASLKPAAKDFRIFWDNAYCVHCLTEKPAHILDIIEECQKAGNPNIVYEFCSTSKVTFPGAGISGVATSAANLADIKGFMKHGTIGSDKLNQLRHARFFAEKGSLDAHMQKHARILNRKFNAVYDALEKSLGDTNIANWTHPEGGYFISFNTLPRCASRAVEMCGEAGVKFTPAGATFPYKKDPENKNIRLAPTFADLADIGPAINLLSLCVKIVSLEELIAE